MCSTQNRDFIHTSYTKIHCFISNRNEVLPLLHKHLNSGSGKNQITNRRYLWTLSNKFRITAFPSKLPSSPDISHTFN